MATCACGSEKVRACSDCGKLLCVKCADVWFVQLERAICRQCQERAVSKAVAKFKSKQDVIETCMLQEPTQPVAKTPAKFGWSRALSRISSATDADLRQIWAALKTQRWQSDTMSSYDGVTMDDWCELVYSEMSNRKMDT